MIRASCYKPEGETDALTSGHEQITASSADVIRYHSNTQAGRRLPSASGKIEYQGPRLEAWY
jgi:hypothetical protein